MKSLENCDSLLSFLGSEFYRAKWGVAMSAARSFAVAPLPALFGVMIDHYLPNGNIKGIGVTAVIFVGLLFVHTGCSVMGARLMGYAITRMTCDMRATVFNRMQFLSFGYLDQSTTGRLLSKYAFDCQKVQDCIMGMCSNILPSLLYGFGVMGFMLFLNWPLALVILLLAPLVQLSRTYSERYMKVRHHEARVAQETLTGSANEMISALRLLRSLGEERKAEERLTVDNDRVAEARFGVIAYASIYGTFVFVSNQLVSLVVIALGAILVIEGHMTLGVLFSFVAALPIIMMPFATIAQFIEQYMVGQESYQSIRELVKCELVEKWQGRHRLEDMKGNICFEHVDFSYPSKEHERVLKDFCLEIKAGESLALVGASGSGKSTIANLVLGLYSLHRGCVKIDGIPQSDLDMRAFRQQCAIVMQDNILLSGTILDNIRFAKEDASDEEVMAAAQAANVCEFVAKMKDGYQTLIGERGVSMSGGQRQRISIARAILRNPKILILDEATSALDNESEALIQEAIERLAAGRTVITIAHRLSTIRNADRVVVMSHGEILEQGSFEELSQQDGAFKRLLESQISMASRWIKPITA